MSLPETDVSEIAKGWAVAMRYSEERLRRVYKLDDEAFDAAIHEGRLVLETVCLFVHACVKRGQYRCVPVPQRASKGRPLFWCFFL
jgi:hypothetical protein